MTAPRPGAASRHELALTPEWSVRLRRWFRYLNQMMVVFWRLGLGPLFGKWPHTAGTILVIHHRGRRTGKAYATPVNYAPYAGAFYCVAAFGEQTDWYRNAMRQGTVEVWLPGRRQRMAVRPADGRSDRTDLIRRVLIHSGFAAPLFGLHPRQMTDAEVADTTAGYCLVELQPVGPPSAVPADLARPAAVATAAVGSLWLTRRFSRRGR